jgi:hypothetical protein
MNSFTDWRSLIFNSTDWVCPAIDTFGTSVQSVDRLDESVEFVSINPLRYGSTRRDDSVTDHRTFLLEIDKMPIAEQLPAIQSLGIPYTSIVFSGAKSLHTLITLTEPVTRNEYDKLISRLMLSATFFDPTTKNPSRLTRVPNALRADTGQVQALIALGSRVPLATLQAWLTERGVPEAPPTRTDKVRAMAERNKQLIERNRGITSVPLNGRTYRFLRYGADRGRNHAEALQAAFDMAACGLDAFKATQLLETAPWPSVEPFEIANIIAHVYSKL